MTHGIKILAKHRFVKSRQAFREGATLFEQGLFLGAVNRFYYAAFYSAKALLATKKLDSSKHSGVISLFHKHFVKTKIVDVEKAKALSRSFEKRQDSDYEDFMPITREDVVGLKNRVQKFISECQNVFKKQRA